jgi:hypothetical protein
LDRLATKNFYDWLARYEPPRPMAGEPGTPGTRPDFLKDPLDDTGAELPSAIDNPPAGPQLGEPGAPADQAPPDPLDPLAPKSSDAAPAPSADSPPPEAKPAPPADQAPPAPEADKPAEQPK